jgi:hypothetical protein
MTTQVPAPLAGTCTLGTLSTLSTGTRSPKWSNRPRRFRAHRPTLETLREYSARLLRYSLTSGPYILDQEQRALADAAAQRAQAELSRPEGGRTGQLDATGSAILARLSAIRHMIARLDQIDRQAPQAAQPTAPAPAQDTNGGQVAPLVPPTPTRPPGGSYADARPYLHRPQPQADGIGF